MALPCLKNARRIFAIVSTTSIPTSASKNHGSQCGPSVPGSRLEADHPEKGGLFACRFTLSRSCARRVLCWLAFPSASALGSTDSAAGCPALFVGFAATIAESDFPRPFIIGYGSSPSRCGPERRTAAGQTWDLPVPVQGASAHARFFDHAGPLGPCDGASETCCLPHSKQRRHPGIGFIAVGMVIADHPPHRSEHALLTHSAPTSSM